MADQASKDFAAQQRIVNHMQADHHDSLVRYLEHYCGLSSWTAGGGRMTAVELDGMTFVAGGESHRIPFGPPLQSYRDARERVVAMDKDCLSALGRSEVTINENPRPTGSFAVMLAVCTAVFLGFSQRWYFEAGQIVEKIFGQSFASFGWTIQPWLLGGMLLVHGAELAWFMPARLRKHSVNVRTQAFWLWAVSMFIAGVFCLSSFDALVEKKRQAKAKQQH